MGRFYRVPMPRTAVTTAVDLLELLSASSHIVWIHKIELNNSTEVGDAEEEMLKLLIKMGQTTSGSGGNTGVTPEPILKGDAAHGMTVESFNTTKASGGTIAEHGLFDWNLRVPWPYVYTPETKLFLPPSTRMTLELVDAPADSVTIGGQMTIEICG